MQPSAFAIELYTKSGDLVADLAGRADGRKIRVGRNKSDSIEWTLNLDELDELAARINTTVDQLLSVNSTEVLVRYGKIYLAGGRLMWSQRRHDGKTRTMSLKVAGFLDLLTRRYTEEDVIREFTATNAAAIPWILVDESQSRGEKWDFGITQGVTATAPDIDDEVIDEELKDKILALADENRFDVEITPEKVLNTWAPQGSRRPSVVFEFPGNIKADYAVTRDGTGTANRIRGLGSGAGSYGSIRSVSEDDESQTEYDVLEAKLLSSATLDEDQLQAETDAERDFRGRPLETVSFSVNGNKEPFLTDYGKGDYVKVEIKKEGVSGFYRVETMEITPNKEDVIDVKLTVSR